VIAAEEVCGEMRAAAGSSSQQGRDSPQSVACDTAFLCASRCQVWPLLWSLTPKLDQEDIRAFQVHLVAGGLSWPALNQTVCALRFASYME
jgi:hypothetical protein